MNTKVVKLSPASGQNVVKFAIKHNALIECREFKSFKRHVVFTTKGIIAVKIYKDKTVYESFHGFDNKIAEIQRDFSVISIKGI